MSHDSGERRQFIDLEKKALVRYTYRNQKFEIIVDPEAALNYKKGEEIPISDIVEGYMVFHNATKGEKASEIILEQTFETDNEEEIVKIILEKGALQLTQAQRKKLLKDKIDEIINFIHVHCINPQTNKPHPPARIESAMDEAGVNIDYVLPAEKQAKDIIKQIQPIIPIRLESVVLAVKVTADFTGPAYGIVAGAGEILEDQWGNDGSWYAKIEMPSGKQADFLDKINQLTKGKAEVKIVERKSE
ncbi:MAG: ribosome assembly factor SBDS [Candidatus Heimdallarchaeota archaeon]|nr:ribosome assembly factor SBDS [Candidatus Heimdallarchaeota archaeon]MCK4289761.1 ribosome assembly factor SBDS [Candidatus Heimdallarchaeota archaeon]